MTALSFDKLGNDAPSWKLIKPVAEMAVGKSKVHKLVGGRKVYFSGVSSSGYTKQRVLDLPSGSDVSVLLEFAAKPGDALDSESIEQSKIMEALSREEWDFRTAEGVANEVGLSKDMVESFLDNSPEVRIAMVPGKQGRKLYTLSQKKAGLREWAAFIQTCLTKKF